MLVGLLAMPGQLGFDASLKLSGRYRALLIGDETLFNEIFAVFDRKIENCEDFAQIDWLKFNLLSDMNWGAIDISSQVTAFDSNTI
jgi:hypothetical protein